MCFYLGSPNSPYYDFIELTVGSSSINVDTTRVNRFGLKPALRLHGHDGSNQEVGESYATFQESRSATFTGSRTRCRRSSRNWPRTRRRTASSHPRTTRPSRPVGW